METPLRILMLTHWTRPHRRANHYARHLAALGHDVTLFMISNDRKVVPKRVERDGVHIVETPDLLWGRLRSGWDPWDTLSRILMGQGRSYDLVHAFETRPVTILPALVMKHLRRLPLIIDCGDWWGRGGTTTERSRGASHFVDKVFSPIETFFEERFQRSADGSIVLCGPLRERLRELGVPAGRILTLPIGSDVARIPVLPKEPARERLGISPTAPVFGYLGAIFPRDADLLLDAFRRLRASRPDARLILIGHCDYTIPAEFAGSVSRTGPLEHSALTVFLAACDAMVLPLRDSLANRGRYPSKVGSYLAAGRPVISTAVGEMPDLFEDSIAGILTPDEPHPFSVAMLQMIHGGDLEERGREARRLAERKLDWAMLAPRVADFYHRVIEARTPARIGGHVSYRPAP